MRASRCAWVVVVASHFACEAAHSPAPAPPAEPAASVARPLCEARCEHAARCSATREEHEGQASRACSCATARETNGLRADWARADIACLRDPKCIGEDECEANAARAVGATPLSWPPVVLRCLQKGDLCGGSGATCRRLVATTGDVAREADVCFAKDCDAYQACFGALWDARVVSAVPAWKN